MKTKTDVKVEENKKLETVQEKPLKSASDKRYDIASFTKAACAPVRLSVVKDFKGREIPEYRGVFNMQKNSVVSVVSADYNLLANKLVVDPVVSFLKKKQIKFEVGALTYVSDQRMRLALTLPELKIRDDSKDGLISVIYVHNSYNMLESFKLIGGALRLVCTNGMVVQKIVERVRVIHQADEIAPRAEKALAKLLQSLETNRKTLEQKIGRMIGSKITASLIKTVERVFEPSITAHIMKEMLIVPADATATAAAEAAKKVTDLRLKKWNQWDVYNMLTEHVSHRILQRYRVMYLDKVGKVFDL